MTPASGATDLDATDGGYSLLQPIDITYSDEGSSSDESDVDEIAARVRHLLRPVVPSSTAAVASGTAPAAIGAAAATDGSAALNWS